MCVEIQDLDLPRAMRRGECQLTTLFHPQFLALFSSSKNQQPSPFDASLHSLQSLERPPQVYEHRMHSQRWSRQRQTLSLLG